MVFTSLHRLRKDRVHSVGRGVVQTQWLRLCFATSNFAQADGYLFAVLVKLSTILSCAGDYALGEGRSATLQAFETAAGLRVSAR